MTRRTDSAFIASSGVARWRLRVQRHACFVAAALWILADAAVAQTPYTTIYLWEYVDPTDPSQGKQASDTGVYPIWWPRAGLGMRPGSADLTQAYLAAADAPGSNFRGTTLVDAYLRGARLGESSFVDVDLTGADLAGANLDFSVFYRADLTKVSLRDAVLSGSSFDETPLIGADFSGAIISGSLYFSDRAPTGVFRLTSFRSTDLRVEQLYSTRSYQDRDLSLVELIGQDMRGWDFSGQDLSFSIIAGTRFRAPI
ncbi:Secreted effector protein pipB2 [Posidoniimonas corsicana]|uniref:Secreted effector protein pipB2 n=1 Tax=Posidoniimonas corsicana TaxID=1938618 RepID=A0A5C5VJA1_9BACT|nr:pentapeptide repeat-containing protein [Posidoniimonas corsicana]TWT38047.1 Secreted effector protein pipB2 [Posidoniimonas corsicana]